MPAILHEGPAATHESISPADTDIAVFRGLYIGMAGDVYVQDVDGNESVFYNVLSGSILPVGGKRVTTDTTASGIVALR